MNQKTLLLMAITIILTASITVAVIAYLDADEDTAHPLTTALPESSNERQLAPVAQLVGGLETRLESDPNDAKGWLLLAKSYDHLGETRKASDAYARAVGLGLSDAEFEFRLVEKTLTEDGWK